MTRAAKLIAGAVGTGVVVVSLVWFPLPEVSILGPRSTESTEMGDGLQIYNALQAYAKDHQGKFPASLRPLVPDYISQDALGALEASGPHLDDWLYFPEASGEDPNAIILASPHLFTHPGEPSRVAVNLARTGPQVLKERIFVSRIVYQLKSRARQTH